jgi:hypothetical protein
MQWLAAEELAALQQNDAPPTSRSPGPAWMTPFEAPGVVSVPVIDLLEMRKQSAYIESGYFD